MTFKQHFIYKLITCLFIYLSAINILVSYKVVGHYKFGLIKIAAIVGFIFVELIMVGLWQLICFTQVKEKSNDINTEPNNL